MADMKNAGTKNLKDIDINVNIAIIVLSVIAIIVLSFLIAGQVSSMGDIERLIADEETAVSNAQAELQQLYVLRDREPDYLHQLSVLEQLVPPGDWEDELLAYLQDHAVNEKMDLLNVNYIERNNMGEYIEMPVQLTLEGTYYSLLGLLDRFRYGRRAIRVDSVNISIMGESSTRLRADIELSAFFWDE